VSLGVPRFQLSTCEVRPGVCLTFVLIMTFVKSPPLSVCVPTLTSHCAYVYLYNLLDLQLQLQQPWVFKMEDQFGESPEQARHGWQQRYVLEFKAARIVLF
jgi:hypothetical protein